MKHLEDLRDKHKGEEIWVIGAGPSLDNFPINFFKNKICIGVNWVFSTFFDIGDNEKKFSSRIFYSVHAHRMPLDWMAKYKPHLLEMCIVPLSPSRMRGMAWWEDYDDPYYMKWGLRGGQGIRASRPEIRNMIKRIMRKRPCSYVIAGTTLHWGISAAAVLGAKKIYLVGAEHRGGRMCKHGSLYVREKDQSHKPSRMKKHGPKKLWGTGTKCFADALKAYGVEMVRYYHGKGEQAI